MPRVSRCAHVARDSSQRSAVRRKAAPSSAIGTNATNQPAGRDVNPLPRSLLPDTAVIDPSGRLSVGGCDVVHLAEGRWEAVPA